MVLIILPNELQSGLPYFSVSILYTWWQSKAAHSAADCPTKFMQNGLPRGEQSVWKRALRNHYSDPGSSGELRKICDLRQLTQTSLLMLHSLHTSSTCQSSLCSPTWLDMHMPEMSCSCRPESYLCHMATPSDPLDSTALFRQIYPEYDPEEARRQARIFRPGFDL